MTSNIHYITCGGDTSFSTWLPYMSAIWFNFRARYWRESGGPQSDWWVVQIDLYIGLPPFAVIVTTRIFTFFVGDPYKPSFATITGKGDNPTYTFKIGNSFSCWYNRLSAWVFRRTSTVAPHSQHRRSRCNCHLWITCQSFPVGRYNSILPKRKPGRDWSVPRHPYPYSPIWHNPGENSLKA